MITARFDNEADEKRISLTGRNLIFVLLDTNIQIRTRGHKYARKD